MTEANHYTNWSLQHDAQDILWLTLDVPDTGTNVLSSAVLGELDQILGELEAHPPRGVVLRSAKDSGFIAGADVNEFDRFPDPAPAVAGLRRAQGILDRLERLPCPTVARIHGYCLGGGLELALACRYRLAEDEPATRLGLPEVRLGIHPGFGGTLRAVRRIGAVDALNLMLTGRSVSAAAAQRLGLVDFALPRRHIDEAARRLIGGFPVQRKLPWWKQAMSSAPLRPLLAAYLRRRVRARTPQEHYPAPYAIIDLWARHWGEPQRLLEAEADSAAGLVHGETAQNLLRVFRLRERLKAHGRDNTFAPRRVHVIGAGVMGGDIAAWCAAQGLSVTVQDPSPEALARTLHRAGTVFEHRHSGRAAFDRLIPDPNGYGLARADVVIEAIVEDVDAKRELFAAIEPRLRADAVLATNTSSIRLETLSEGLQHPGRLVGLHFFNPVAKMPLVEVVHGKGTDPQMAARAQAFARCIDRLPLPVRSTPGFLVNRILMPYLLEAVTLIEEGVPGAVVDRAAVEFGMPMGPVELADTVGLDVCLSVAEILSRELDGSVPERLRTLVAAGQLGKKSGAGFYPFRGGKPQKQALPKGYQPPEDVQDRLVLRLLNEAVACLREGVVSDADLVDAGVIFGTGFAPFRGGPLHYAERRGPVAMQERLHVLAQRHGERFQPDPGWTRLEDTAEGLATSASAGTP